MHFVKEKIDSVTLEEYLRYTFNNVDMVALKSNLQIFSEKVRSNWNNSLVMSFGCWYRNSNSFVP